MNMQDESIQKIIDKIINYSGLTGMDPSEERIFRENMEAQITRRLGLIIIENLDESGLVEYEKLIKNGEPDQKKFENFIKKNIPNYEQKVGQGIEELMKEAIAAARS